MMERPILAALLSVEGTRLSDAEKRLFERFHPLGVTLFTRNLTSAEQAKRLINEIKGHLHGDQTVIALDSEGGRVNRLKAAGFPDYAFQETLARTENPEKSVVWHAQLMARDMLSVGANLNFAPVLDVAHEGMTNALLGRVFSSDPTKVGKLGKRMIETYVAAGICPCMKHMPGHGRAKTDPHLGLPVIDASLQELESDFLPFQVCRDCPAGMTAHILLPFIDAQNPLTQSAKGIRELIRGIIGFDGLLFSDAIEMRALRGDVVQKAQACWEAGCDVVCYCLGNTSEAEELCRHGKYLSDQGLTRLSRVFEVWRHKPTNMLDLNEKDYYSVLHQVEEIHVAYDATEVLHQLQKGEK